MCKKLNIHILNGRLKGDNQGEYTFVSHLGKSAIDYCITSSLLFQYVTDFSVLSTDISDHFPIECIFNVCKSYKKSDIARECLNPKLTYKWDQNKATDFRVALQEIVTNGELSHFSFVVENSVNVNDATKILCQSIQYAGKCMLRNNKSKNTNCQPIWWTRELSDLKALKYINLNNYRKSRKPFDLDIYLQTKNRFKSLCEEQKQKLGRDRINSLIEIKDPNDMWKKLKYFNKTNSNNSISTDQWFEHFQNLLTEDNTSSGSALREEINLTLSDPTEVVSDILDNPISHNEIIKALNKMKTGKSGGEDGLVIKMFKTTIDILLPWLCLLFNKILISSTFPDSWSRAVIYPIYKKGDVTNPCNYGGISLLNVMGKIFTKVTVYTY
ncbi:hypothetical protein SNE40_009671 [Patella caerulea]|uniref:Uncharacterized protein n=1 Tax=Patella caerulea TaxID=87958 RepID=A0AAN8JVZ9_PATCE